MSEGRRRTAGVAAAATALALATACSGSGSGSDSGSEDPSPTAVDIVQYVGWVGGALELAAGVVLLGLARRRGM